MATCGVPTVTRALLAALLLAGCSRPDPARDLRELAVEDSTYYDPVSGRPFTGRVFRPFSGDSTRIEIEGRLLDGAWDGELRVFHPSGRVRYEGAFSMGSRCGPWTENASDRETEDAYEGLLSEVESMAIYPPCVAELR
jgi:hypothetical protein